MLVCENERDALRGRMMKGRHEYQNLIIRHLFHAAMAGFNIQHHDRVWSKVERNIIAKRPSRRDSDGTARPLVDQINITYVSVVRIDDRSVSSVHAIVEYPWRIIAMHDAKNKCLLLI